VAPAKTAGNTELQPRLASLALTDRQGPAAAAPKVSFEDSEDEGGYGSMTSEEHGFAHDWNQVSPQQLSAMAFKAQHPSLPPKSKPCYDYLRGACDLGKDCAYSHDKEICAEHIRQERRKLEISATRLGLSNLALPPASNSIKSPTRHRRLDMSRHHSNQLWNPVSRDDDGEY